MKHKPFLSAASSRLLVLSLFFLWMPPALHASEQAELALRPDKPQPIMPLKDVRVGMKGYGLSVFHGVKIEPFAVEVVSVEGDFNPQHPVIWVRCPDERMQKTGPVSGMSGSPIYLWPEGAEQEPGKNGLLIGAFAFGFGMSRDCYAGVQPIESMRGVGERAAKPPEGDVPVNGRVGAASASQQLDTLLQSAQLNGVPEQHTWRARALADILTPRDVGAADGESNGESGDKLRGAADAKIRVIAPPRRTVPAPLAMGGQAQPLMLPINVGSASMARLLAPVLEPSGLLPLQSPAGLTVGKPPAGIDPGTVRLQPGSVLTIPLAYGDLDLSASGTVTDVLPDGRVLAFGHAMFGQGPSELPVATGFVHFVQASITTSFKYSGSSALAGTLVRDEASAVVAKPGIHFGTAPVNVVVKYPGLEERTYRYHVAHHREFTPMITAMVAAMSMTAERDLPVESTVVASGTLRFEGDREYNFKSIMPGGSLFGVFFMMSPPIAGMLNNDFETIKLVSADVRLDIEPVIRSATLIGVRLDKTEFAPGDTLGINLRFQPYRAEVVEKRIEMKVPEHLPDGVYPMMITGASGYHRWVMRNRPHRQITRDVNDILDSSQDIANVADDAVYVLMQLPSRGLAVGREELPQLPESRAVLIGSPTSTLATPFGDWSEKKVPMPWVPEGELQFQIAVSQELKK